MNIELEEQVQRSVVNLFVDMPALLKSCGFDSTTSGTMFC